MPRAIEQACPVHQSAYGAAITSVLTPSAMRSCPEPRCWTLTRAPYPLCRVALEKLGAVERAYAALAAATRFKGSKLSQDVLALDHLLSLLFTACTRVGLRQARMGWGWSRCVLGRRRCAGQRLQCQGALGGIAAQLQTLASARLPAQLFALRWSRWPVQVRRMFVLLPEALGRDQPGCLALVLAHFEGPGAVEWSFEALTQVRHGKRPDVSTTCATCCLRAGSLLAGVCT